MGQPQPHFRLFLVFSKTIQFLLHINVKKFHVNPEYGTGIWTHNLLNMSRLP